MFSYFSSSPRWSPPEPQRLCSGRQVLGLLRRYLKRLCQGSQAPDPAAPPLEQLLDALPVGVVVHQSDGTPVFINRHGRNILGVEALSALPHHHPLWLASLGEALAGRQVLNEELEVRRADGLVPIQLTATPVYADDASIAYVVCAFNDITQRKQTEHVMLHYHQRLEHTIQQRTKALQAANRELQRLATLDSLTQVANRGYFNERLTLEWQHQQRLPLSLLLLDVDFFKPYNDVYGHPQGDECLVRITQAVASVLHRPGDLLARYGGEEFVVILPGTDLAGARWMAETLLQTVRELQIPHRGSRVAPWVSISIGVASQVPTVDASPEALIHAADRALYAAKQGGRNTYRVAGLDA